MIGVLSFISMLMCLQNCRIHNAIVHVKIYRVIGSGVEIHTVFAHLPSIRDELRLVNLNVPESGFTASPVLMVLVCPKE